MIEQEKLGLHNVTATDWARLERSAAFSRSPGSYRLLRYLAADSAINAEGPKDAVIGTEFFGRKATYDARYDSIVRVNVTRLRKCLREYYESEGRGEPFRIEIPRGAYAVVLLRAHEPIAVEEEAFDEPGLDANATDPSGLAPGIHHSKEAPVAFGTGVPSGEHGTAPSQSAAISQNESGQFEAAGYPSGSLVRFPLWVFSRLGHRGVLLVLVCVAAASAIVLSLTRRTPTPDNSDGIRRFERGSSNALAINTVDPQPTPVGSTSVQQAVITFPVSVKLNPDPAIAIQVVTQGVADADFRYANGGTCKAGKMYRAGQSCTVKFTFSPETPGQRMGAIVLLDRSTVPAPALTIYIARTGVGPLPVIAPGTISTILGGPNNLGTQLDNNQGLAIDPNGVLFVADAANNRVLKVTNGTAVPYGPRFIAPVALALDGAGNLYVANYGTEDVYRIERVTGNATLVPGATNLRHINGLAVDAAGNLYAPGGNIVYRISPDGTIRKIAGTGVAGYNGDYIPATSADLNNPTGFAIDPAGNIYISDTHNNRIRRVDVAGIITTIAGTGEPGFSGDGGPATAARLFHPDIQLSLDAAGDLFFNDRRNHRIREITAAGIINTVAGNGTTDLVEGVPATSSGLNNNAGLVMDAEGNLYESDNVTNVVRRITATAAPIVFPDTPMRHSSAPRSMMLHNLGNSALTFSAIQSSDKNFTFASSECGKSLRPGSCSISATFTPQSNGLLHGEGVVANDTQTIRQTVSLSGKASERRH